MFYHIPSSGVRTQLPLYWDDSPVGLSTNLTGCLNPVASACRAWGTFQGNERFMNTWSSAFVSTSSLTNVSFQGCRPSAVRDVAFLNQADSIFILPFANDLFPGAALNPNSFSFLSLPSNGQISYNPSTQQVKYEPIPSFFGLDSVRYEICDQGAPSFCTTAWMVFNVVDVNVPPVVDLINGNPPNQNVPVTTNEDTPVSICFDVTDIDGDNISISAISLPSHGNVSGLSDGDTCFLYTPNADYVGPDTVVINVCDNGFPIRCTQVLVPINVLPVNDKPNIVAVGNQPTVNDTVYHSTPEDIAKILCLIVVDVDLGQSGNVSSLSSQVPGSNFSVNPATGCPVYTPAPNYNGNDTLRVVFCDNGVPSLCDTTYIIMTVLPVNDKPVAMPDQTAVDPGGSVCIKPMVNDTDIDGNSLSFIVIGAPSLGTFTLAGDSLCYTPNPGVIFGIDSIYYRVCDNGSPVRCDTALIRIFIPAGPYPPIAVTDSFTLNEDQPITFNPLLNDFDPNQDPIFLLYPPVTPPVNGIVSISGNQWTYIPFQDFCGRDSLEYQIFDGTGLSSTGWIYFTILCEGDKPVALNPQGIPTNTLVYNILEDTPTQLCMNLQDADGDGVDVTGVFVTGTVPMSVTGLADGDSCFTVIPDPDYFGTVLLNFIICDDGNPSLCDTIITTINVLPVNDAPIARPDMDTTTAGTPKLITVITNDTDIDGQINLSSITILTPPSNGTAVANQITARITYTPAAGFLGLDTLVYRICDNGTPLPAQCDTALLVIRVVPRAFTLSSYNGYCENNIAKLSWDITDLNFPAGSANPLTIYWLDPSGTVITTNTNLPLSGNIIWPGMALDINGNPIDWPGWFLQAGQWVSGIDGYEGLRPQATVVFSINPSDTVVVNYPISVPGCSANPAAEPVANNDTVTVPNSAITNINAIANDISPLGRPISIVSIPSGPFIGTAVIQSGQLAYTPLSGYCGPDSLRYQICDNGGLCSSAWVYINVQQVDTDNDGLNDAYETDTRDSDGRRDFRDPDSDDDGMSDEFESRRIGDDCAFTTQDWDNDGVPDWRDLDSDNDGITDFIERATIVVLNANRDLNGDGIDDAYDPLFGGYLEDSPVDTDGDGSPDYLDLDSDNDGIKDYEEGFLLPNYPRGIDSDNDGLDDAYDLSSGGFLGLNPADTDGDGIPDWRDPDSDNDGIADGANDPFGSDCNGNGIPVFRDPTPCNIFIPAGMSPNGDNSNDVFFIGNLENYPNNYLQIFNRWGIKVYQSETPYDNAWDGIVNEGSSAGDLLPSGVYYYILHLNSDESLPPLTGSLTIITE